MKISKPLFARLLESQALPQVKSHLKAGDKKVTMKYPSDDDEPGITEKVTMKYPSDTDDG